MALMPHTSSEKRRFSRSPWRGHRSEPKDESAKLRQRSVDDLWVLREEVAAILERKLSIERERLEDHSRTISALSHVDRRRRPYPKVLPKYLNPKNPNETWSGRGK